MEQKLEHNHANSKTLWLYSEANNHTFEHKIDTDCDCEVCESKPRLIVVQ